MQKYKFLSKKSFSHKGYSLKIIRDDDIERIRIWRNQQIDFLRQNKILTKNEQQKYFDEVIKRSWYEDDPNIILFSVFYKTKIIGYGGFVHINWNDMRAELSFLTDPKRMDSETYQKDIMAYLHMICNIGFTNIGFNKITTETFDIRPITINALESFGFELEGRLRRHIKIKNRYVDSLIHGFNKDEYHCNNTINILVMSISKKVPLINSIRESTKKMNRKIQIIGADSNRKCVGRYFVDEFWNSPKLEKLSIKSMIRFCKKKKIVILIPTRDEELNYFAKYKKILEKNNIAVMVSDKETVECCLDKNKFFKKLNGSGLPVIETTTKIDELKCKKYVVKERYGAGSKNLRMDLSKKEAIQHSTNLRNPIFQPYIKGDEFSVDLFVGKKKRILGCIVRKRNLVENGESQITERIENKRIENVCKKIVGELNFYGHIVVQLIMEKNQRIHVVECNCRFGGASTLSVMIGLDSFVWFILESQKKKVDVGHISFNLNRKQIRYAVDRIIL